MFSHCSMSDRKTNPRWPFLLFLSALHTPPSLRAKQRRGSCGRTSRPERPDVQRLFSSLTSFSHRRSMINQTSKSEPPHHPQCNMNRSVRAACGPGPVQGLTSAPGGSTRALGGSEHSPGVTAVPADQRVFGSLHLVEVLWKEKNQTFQKVEVNAGRNRFFLKLPERKR